MCGIAAIFNYRTGQPVARDEMQRVLAHMQRRGPDGSGEWFGLQGSVALGHRRLSIIDLSNAGAQPMSSQNGKCLITFNGEIYNYRELRAELETKGRHFRSHSDTEVLLHLYELEGERMLQKLRGMYAFAIWDDERRGMFLARDPFGIKPLYYADNGQTFRAASQVKALLATGAIDTAPEPAGHVGFFLWGHVPAPHTLYKQIRVLPAGSSMWVEARGASEPQIYCNIPEILAAAEQRTLADSSAVTVHSILHHALADSVRHHLVADVPVGVFLSSGLDSTTITALAAEQSASLRTVTLGFEEFRGTPNDETPMAEQVAARYGAQHQTIWVGKRDFRDNFARLMEAMDQPSCDGVNSFFISHAASTAGLKVALSGLGGDELFGSYPSFQQIPKVVSRLRAFRSLKPFNRAFRVVSAPLLRRFTSPKYAGLFEYGGTYGGAYLLRRGMFMPWELPDLLDPDLVREGWLGLRTLERLGETTQAIQAPHLRVAALEMTWYMRHQLLRDTDWASMNHSLEVRTPLVDIELLKATASLLASDSVPSKKDMADAPARKLPDEVLRRPKTGFAIPVRDWLLEQRPELRGQKSSSGRGLRGWAKLVYAQFTEGTAAAGPASRIARRRLASEKDKSAGQNPSTARIPERRTSILVLAGDAFGGHGGIAKFNRDLLKALCSFSSISEVVALPRVISQALEPLPPLLTYVTEAANDKIAYGLKVLRAALRSPRPDVIVCGHIHLLPFAYMCSLLGLGRRARSPVVLVIHGIEAWQPRARVLVDRLAARVDFFVAVSQLTKDRFLLWTRLPPGRGFILPNCVDASNYGPGPRSPELMKRYGLYDKTIIMTLGRLASEERYKGFDEVLEILPSLAIEVPNLVYLIAGDGRDRPRLEAKARELNVQDRVIFAGKIPENEKADHYRLADAYVMPSRGEGFGIVYLEAMACGVPVVASKVDGSREAVRDGELGEMVDPARPDEIKAAILKTLSRKPWSPSRGAPAGLDYFSYENFEKRCHTVLEAVMDNGTTAVREKRNQVPVGRVP